MADLGRVDFDPSGLIINVGALRPKVRRAIRFTMTFHATRAVAYARQNAPWTDRTTNARNGLHATVKDNGNLFALVVAHGVPYGVWLEVRYSGRFAIIRPTLDHEGPLLMAHAERLVQRVLEAGA